VRARKTDNREKKTKNFFFSTIVFCGECLFLQTEKKIFFRQKFFFLASDCARAREKEREKEIENEKEKMRESVCARERVCV